MTFRAMPLCFVCLRLHAKVREGGVRTAFPAGIPRDIWLSEIDHRQPVVGDDVLTLLPLDAAAVTYANLQFPRLTLATIPDGTVIESTGIERIQPTRQWVDLAWDAEDEAAADRALVRVAAAKLAAEQLAHSNAETPT